MSRKRICITENLLKALVFYHKNPGARLVDFMSRVYATKNARKAHFMPLYIKKALEFGLLEKDEERRFKVTKKGKQVIKLFYNDILKGHLTN